MLARFVRITAGALMKSFDARQSSFEHAPLARIVPAQRDAKSTRAVNHDNLPCLGPLTDAHSAGV
jgi:hypothetical protein